MKWYIGLTALAVLIAYGIETQEPDSRYGVTRRKAQSQVLFAAVFLLLFGVSACRVSVGNDYGEYLKLFERISLRMFLPKSASMRWWRCYSIFWVTMSGAAG